MKKQSVFLIGIFLMIVTSCHRDSSTTPTPTAPVSPYYFKFGIDGSSYNLNANIPQYMVLYVRDAGGYQVGNANFFPSAGIRLSWRDTVREADIMGLAGRTLYFDDTAIHPEITFEKDAASDIWYSEDTSNHSYNVKINSVAFLKKDTSLGYALRTYVINGTCSAVMFQSTKSIFSAGEFNFIISRRDY